jgi:hypothetical protein
VYDSEAEEERENEEEEATIFSARSVPRDPNGVLLIGSRSSFARKRKGYITPNHILSLSSGH